MAYLALYRKYRSRTFDELAGQTYIVKTLQNSLKNGEISHAYLFCGPRGTGKTSMARLFAKALNCSEGFGHICNECENCNLINDGVHPDVIEIDAASNSSVDQIRSLIEKVKYAPLKGRYKVYIIDEVHMLSNSAFNALLKTLEEPPEDVVFILATTEPHKVLPTIISRCQRFDFTKISDHDIKDRLLSIMRKENIVCDTEALNELISLSDGCMRDALSILDQLVAYTNKSIHYSDILQVFGLISINEQTDFLGELFAYNVEEVIKRYHQYEIRGADIMRLNINLIDILKDILIFKTTKNKDLLVRLPLDLAVNLSELVDLEYLNALIDVFIKASGDLKSVSNVASTYEIVLLKACSIENKSIRKPAKVEQKIQNDVKIENQVDEQSPVVSHVEEPLDEPVPYVENEELSKELEDKPIIKYDDDILMKAIVKSTKLEKVKLYNLWSTISNYSTDLKYAKYVAALKSCSIFTLCDELLIVQTQFKTILPLINAAANNADVSELISLIYGSKIKIYAIDLSEASRLQTTYYNLRQIDRLPKKDEIGKIFK